MKNPIYIGNGTKDMILAKNANIKAIGVTTANTAEELKGAGVDHIIQIVNDLPVLLELKSNS